MKNRGKSERVIFHNGESKITFLPGTWHGFIHPDILTGMGTIVHLTRGPYQSLIQLKSRSTVDYIGGY